MNSMPSTRGRSSLLLMAVVFLAASSSVASPIKCAEAAPGGWVANLHERMLSFDMFGLFAVERFGEPVTCVGEVTAEFDGMEFGRLRFAFGAGAEFSLETFPPEASRVELSVPSGIPAASNPRQRLREYTANIGVEIDWSSPEITRDGAVTVETFRDPDDGLNSSAQVVSTDGKITALRFAMAL